MIEYGIDKSLVERRDDSRSQRGWRKGFFSFRKMFWDYLTKLNVPFYDACCPAQTGVFFPVRFNGIELSLERFDGTDWVLFDDVSNFVGTVTAFSGGGQGSATQLETGYSNVTTVAAPGDSVKLPAAVESLSVTVKNNGASNLAVFPFTGDAIDGGSVNASITVIPNGQKTFFATSTSNWETDTQVIQTASVTTNTITESTSGAGITLSKPIIRQPGTAFAVNVTGAITAAQLAGGLITSTSAAAVTATLPTAPLFATQIGGARGTQFEFIVDNSLGANTVTVAVNTGITVGTTALTGGDSLTISTAQVVGVFRLVYTSATTAIIRRIA